MVKSYTITLTKNSFKKSKEDYIETKQTFSMGSNKKTRKAKWEGCSKDFQTDYNTN